MALFVLRTHLLSSDSTACYTHGLCVGVLDVLDDPDSGMQLSSFFVQPCPYGSVGRVCAYQGKLLKLGRFCAVAVTFCVAPCGWPVSHTILYAHWLLQPLMV